MKTTSRGCGGEGGLSLYFENENLIIIIKKKLGKRKMP